MATSQDTTKDPAAKRAARRLLSQGTMTQAEAAKLAGVSRQLMAHWSKDIPARENREAVLARLWRRAMNR